MRVWNLIEKRAEKLGFTTVREPGCLTMRISLKRVVLWTIIIVCVQVVIYYWMMGKPKSERVNAPPLHEYLKGLDIAEGTCSTKKCPPVKEGVINVHLIPHSHIDVGWVKTVEQYYVGEGVPGVWATGCVKCTFEGSIAELLKNESRRFIFVEMKYLSRYWDEISEGQRDTIKQLITERRLEIINGGWVMSDSGVTMYNDIIDQHTLGFDFIRDKFGPCAQPRTAWHIDQFGHTREHSSIFAQMGYDSLFIGRIDFRDVLERQKKKEMEFVWKTSPVNFKTKSSLFTHIIYGGYYAPSPFNFEVDNYVWNYPEVRSSSAAQFIKILKERAQAIQTNHLLVPMGCDFGYNGPKAAANWFTSMDTLIQEIHQNQNEPNGMTFNLLYSTPSCYTYHVNKAKYKLPVKEDDFHPYGIEPGVYWTGYFTTRGGFKMHIRKAGQILQSCKQLAIFTELDEMFNKVNKLRDAMAVMQHHDAVTGTQRLAVLNDYNKELSKSTEQCEMVMSTAYQQLWNPKIGLNINQSELSSHFCHDLNISSCDISENNQQFLISFYNSLSWSVNVFARLPVKSEEITIIDDEGTNVPAQIVPIPEGILTIPERKSKAETEAVFQIQLPPMSVTAFKVTSEKDAVKPEFMPNPSTDIIIENEHLSLKFNSINGKLVSVFNKESDISESILQEFAYYTIRQIEQKTSGAYLFVPNIFAPTKIAPDNVKIKIIKGKVVQEVHQTFSNWVSQVVRVYKDSHCAEFQWTVGPLQENVGKEVISRFTSGISSGDKFFTDSNGREIMTRTRKSEGKGTDHVADPISGNYFPVTSRIYIRDNNKKIQLTILPDRPQAGSSLESGSIELLVHRNTLYDDDLGIAEALQDKGTDGKGIIFTGKHYVCLDTVEKSAKLTRRLAHQLHLGPVPMFSHLEAVSPSGSVPKQHMFLSAPLPDNVNILTLDMIPDEDANYLLLRLEHIFEENEDPELSKPVTVLLEPLFKLFKIVSAEETTLGGNFKPHDIDRLKWNTVNGETPSSIKSPNYKEVMEPPFAIELLPMEIRTFRVTVVSI